MLIFFILIGASKIDYQIRTPSCTQLFYAHMRAIVLLDSKSEKWPLVALYDLRGKNEYAYNLDVVNLVGVCEIKFLARIGHFSVKRVQTGNTTHIAFIYLLYRCKHEHCEFTKSMILDQKKSFGRKFFKLLK